MTYRVSFVIAVALVGGLLVPAVEAQKRDGIELGKKFEGEIKEFLLGNWYKADVPITLRAGQPVTITATVVGAGRKVQLQLLDPTGVVLHTTAPETKTARYQNEEVSATGKYTIRVVSDRIGPFSVRATGPSETEVDIKALETRVEELRRDLAKAEAELKALKGKSGRLPNPIEK